MKEYDKIYCNKFLNKNKFIKLFVGELNGEDAQLFHRPSMKLRGQLVSWFLFLPCIGIEIRL